MFSVLKTDEAKIVCLIKSDAICLQEDGKLRIIDEDLFENEEVIRLVETYNEKS